MPWLKRLKFYPRPENVSVESEVITETTEEPEAPAETEPVETPEASEPEAEPTAEPTVEPTEEPEVPEVEPTEEPVVEPTEAPTEEPLTACPSCGVLASRDPLFETNHAACDACGLRNCDPAHARKAHTACSGCGLRKCAEDFVEEEHMKCAGCREMLCASEVEHISCPGCHRYSCKEADQYDTYNHTLNDYGRYPCLDYPEEPEVEEPEEEEQKPEVKPEEPQATLITNEQELLAAIQTPGNYKLGAKIELTNGSVEIPAGANVTLDLGGFDITGDENTPAIINKGNLTLKGSGAVSGKSAVENYGTLKIEGGSFKATGGAVVYNRANANATITGGSFTSETGDESAILNEGGTLNISGSGTKVSSLRHTVETDQNGSTTISGGTFEIREESSIGAHVIYMKSGDLTINGGTFDRKNSNSGGVVTFWDADVTITNGKFTGGDNPDQHPVIDIFGKNSTLTITGGEFHGKGRMVHDQTGTGVDGSNHQIKSGTFDLEPNSKFIPTGYKATESNGKWVVAAE